MRKSIRNFKIIRIGTNFHVLSLFALNSLFFEEASRDLIYDVVVFVVVNDGDYDDDEDDDDDDYDYDYDYDDDDDDDDD